MRNTKTKQTVRPVRFFRQRRRNDCAAACLQTVAAMYKRRVGYAKAAELTQATSAGTSLYVLRNAFESLGLPCRALAVQAARISELELPLVLHCDERHYVVVCYEKANTLFIADPAAGKYTIQSDEVALLAGSEQLKVLSIGAPAREGEHDDPEDDTPEPAGAKVDIKPLLQILPVLLPMAAVSAALTAAIPQLTRQLFDVAGTGDNGTGTLIVASAICAGAGIICAETIRKLFLWAVSRNAVREAIAEHIRKALSLPLRFFHGRSIGDALQKVNDEKRVVETVSSSGPSTIHSCITYIALIIVLGILQPVLALCYAGTTLFSAVLNATFRPRRRGLRTLLLRYQADDKAILVHSFQRILDVKTHGTEEMLHGKWKANQAVLEGIESRITRFDAHRGALTKIVSQARDIGFLLIGIYQYGSGALTMGDLLALQLTIGMLSGPSESIGGLVGMIDDFETSRQRLREMTDAGSEHRRGGFIIEPGSPEIVFHNVTFSYEREMSPALTDFSATIRRGKINAIIGPSGSGKTTVIKLILGLYTVDSGNLLINGHDICTLDLKSWRGRCATVMQNGFIGNGTIAENVVLQHVPLDESRLRWALQAARINSVIDGLPQQERTELRGEEVPLSSGQRQRLLWARAFYQMGDVVLLDEPTSALDGATETEILQEVARVWAGKTILLIAHRLSLVRNADHIIMIDKGRCTACGPYSLMSQSNAGFQEWSRRSS